MWKKRYSFDSLEQAYLKKYGKDSFDHMDELRKTYGSKQAAQIVQSNMNEIWTKAKERTGYIGQGFFLTEKTGARVPFDTKKEE